MAKESNASSPLSDREEAICYRVREVRLGLRWSQPAFAESLVVSRERLASYEFARAPIRYEFGRKLCHRFDINQRWLATGQAPMKHRFRLNPNLDYEVKPRELFSEAYDRVLQPAMEVRFSELVEMFGPDLVQSGGFEAEGLNAMRFEIEEDISDLCSTVSLQAHFLPEPLRSRLFSTITEAMLSFIAENKSEIRRIAAERKQRGANIGISALTEFPPKSKQMAVSPDFAKLLDRLNAVTKAPGMKGELAAFLGVARSRVSEWLAGKKVPGGETTLRLLEWAEKEEAKQKRPRSVSTTARAKVRK